MSPQNHPLDLPVISRITVRMIIDDNHECLFAAHHDMGEREHGRKACSCGALQVRCPTFLALRKYRGSD